MTTKTTLLNGLGFTNVTETVVENLKGKTTKAAQAVLDRIADSETYQVYTNGTVFVINSSFMKTAQEKTLIGKILGCEFENVESVMKDNGLREQWINATDEVETVELVTEEVAEVVETKEVSEPKLPTADQIEIIVNKLGKERLTEEEQELMFNYEMAVRTGLIKEITEVKDARKADELELKLEEFRIPKKYHEAIADISGGKGCEYNIELNKGYVFKWGEISAIEYTYKEFMDAIRSIQTYEQYGRDTSNIERMYEELS